MLSSLSRRVHRIGAVLTVSALAMAGACESSSKSDEVTPPFSSSQLDEANYQDVVTQFEAAGFTNITTEAIPDLITGWLTDDGEVEEVSIAGNTEFSSSDNYDPAVKVVVRYHTFPEDEPDPPASQLPATTQPSEPGTISPTSEASPSERQEPTAAPAPATLTADNNADLAAILELDDPFDPSVAEFASTYEGQTIEFDGCVVNVAPHGSYDTRFDYLLSVGDYDPNSAQGPYFQFSDVNYYDFGFPADSSPESVDLGMNLHFVAKVGEYDPASGLFQLDPIATTIR